MPEQDFTEKKNFYEDIPQRNSAFFLKGAGAYDWGMQNRLARIFNPESGKTVMLAIDHGYFQGPTTGLERIELRSLLDAFCDALQVKIVAHRDDGAHKVAHFRISADMVDKALINLDLVQWQVLDLAEAGIAGAKIIE